jgi:excisionase family DNA binding protein
MSCHLLTARAVAELLDLSPETILRWTRRGELPGIRLPGGAVRFREDELDGWLRERATPGRGSVSHPAGAPPGCRLAVSATPEDEEN